MTIRTLIPLAVFGLVGCSQGGGASPVSGPSGINFELDCEPASTATSAQMQCVRTDTRNGEVLVIEYMRLPTSNGPTATGALAPGRFTTACAAPGSDTRAEFYCVRMNTETGELLLVNLTKVGVLPPKTQ